MSKQELIDASPRLAHPARDEIELVGVLHAFADPVRLAIVRRLAAEGECACGTFDVGVSRSTLSHHFRTLRESGVTQVREVGTFRYSRLRRDDLDARFPGLLDSVLGS
jgi:DNA-binding transcriptional ArsR family regulator